MNICNGCNKNIEDGGVLGCKKCGATFCENCGNKSMRICPNCYSDMEFIG